MTLTVKDIPRIIKVIKPDVNRLLLAMAYAEVEKERCDAIKRRLLGTGSYGGNGNPDDFWHTSTEDQAKRFYADCDAAYREAGYKDLEPGHCPALIADDLQVRAEWALIEAAEQFFPDVTNDKLLCGTEKKGGLETRREYLDLLIGVVVNSPGFASPLHKAAWAS